MIYEILEHRQVLDGRILELHSTSSRADLRPGIFRNFLIMYDSALDLVYVDELAVAAEYFYFGVPFPVLIQSQIPDAKPSEADILDLSHINEFIGSHKSSKCPFFGLESLEFSFFLRHSFPLFQVPPGRDPFRTETNPSSECSLCIYSISINCERGILGGSNWVSDSLLSLK